MRKIKLSLFIALFTALGLNAQVTTGSISGFIKDNQGKTLSGASVLAVHEPSGTKYKTMSTNEGRFNLAGLRIGGPYKLTISYVGFNQQDISDITIQLGEPSRIDVSLDNSQTQLQEVVVSGTRKGALISKELSS